MKVGYVVWGLIVLGTRLMFYPLVWSTLTERTLGGVHYIGMLMVVFGCVCRDRAIIKAERP